MRKKIAILRGGPSAEYDVSLKTGKHILDSLGEDHDVLDIIVDKNGDWYVSGLKKEPYKALEGVDAVFNALHGEYGENGKVQQLLEQLKVPYTGARALAAALSMNKGKTKEYYEKNGIKTPVYKILSKPETDGGIDFQASLIFNHFVMPVIIKPVDKGSSYGVSVARDFKSLRDAMESVYQSNDKIVVEEYIQGKEATVSVIDKMRGQKHYPLFPIEIRKPKQKLFFDNDLKRQLQNLTLPVSEELKIENNLQAAEEILLAEKLCPGNFTKEESKQLQDLAIKAHQVLDMRHYSRTDFIIHPRRGIYALETNSLPWLTKDSLMSYSLEEHGIKYKDFLLHILGLL